MKLSDVVVALVFLFVVLISSGTVFAETCNSVGYKTCRFQLGESGMAASVIQCNANNEWVNVENCPAGLGCTSGRCHECKAGDLRCNSDDLQKCDASPGNTGFWTLDKNCPTGCGGTPPDCRSGNIGYGALCDPQNDECKDGFACSILFNRCCFQADNQYENDRCSWATDGYIRNPATFSDTCGAVYSDAKCDDYPWFCYGTLNYNQNDPNVINSNKDCQECWTKPDNCPKKLRIQSTDCEQACESILGSVEQGGLTSGWCNVDTYVKANGLHVSSEQTCTGSGFTDLENVGLPGQPNEDSYGCKMEDNAIERCCCNKKGIKMTAQDKNFAYYGAIAALRTMATEIKQRWVITYSENGKSLFRVDTSKSTPITLNEMYTLGAVDEIIREIDHDYALWQQFMAGQITEEVLTQNRQANGASIIPFIGTSPDLANQYVDIIAKHDPTKKQVVVGLTTKGNFRSGQFSLSDVLSATVGYNNPQTKTILLTQLNLKIPSTSTKTTSHEYNFIVSKPTGEYIPIFGSDGVPLWEYLPYNVKNKQDCITICQSNPNFAGPDNSDTGEGCPSDLNTIDFGIRPNIFSGVGICYKPKLKQTTETKHIIQTVNVPSTGLTLKIQSQFAYDDWTFRPVFYLNNVNNNNEFEVKAMLGVRKTFPNVLRFDGELYDGNIDMVSEYKDNKFTINKASASIARTGTKEEIQITRMVDKALDLVTFSKPGETPGTDFARFEDTRKAFVEFLGLGVENGGPDGDGIFGKGREIYVAFKKILNTPLIGNIAVGGKFFSKDQYQVAAGNKNFVVLATQKLGQPINVKAGLMYEGKDGWTISMLVNVAKPYSISVQLSQKLDENRQLVLEFSKDQDAHRFSAATNFYLGEVLGVPLNLFTTVGHGSKESWFINFGINWEFGMMTSNLYKKDNNEDKDKLDLPAGVETKPLDPVVLENMLLDIQAVIAPKLKLTIDNPGSESAIIQNQEYTMSLILEKEEGLTDAKLVITCVNEANGGKFIRSVVTDFLASEQPYGHKQTVNFPIKYTESGKNTVECSYVPYAIDGGINTHSLYEGEVSNTIEFDVEPEGDTPPPSNNPPKLASISVFPSSPVVGQQITVTASAFDKENSDLSFKCCLGSGCNPNVANACTNAFSIFKYPYNGVQQPKCTYTASEAGSQTVNCVVNDGQDNSNKLSTTYTVISETGPKICRGIRVANCYDISVSQGCDNYYQVTSGIIGGTNCYKPSSGTKCVAYSNVCVGTPIASSEDSNGKRCDGNRVSLCSSVSDPIMCGASLQTNGDGTANKCALSINPDPTKPAACVLTSNKCTLSFYNRPPWCTGPQWYTASCSWLDQASCGNSVQSVDVKATYRSCKWTGSSCAVSSTGDCWPMVGGLRSPAGNVYTSQGSLKNAKLVVGSCPALDGISKESCESVVVYHDFSSPGMHYPDGGLSINGGCEWQEPIAWYDTCVPCYNADQGSCPSSECGKFTGDNGKTCYWYINEAGAGICIDDYAPPSPDEKGICRNTYKYPVEPPECSDGIDNDGDGGIDLDDPNCIPTLLNQAPRITSITAPKFVASGNAIIIAANYVADNEDDDVKMVCCVGATCTPDPDIPGSNVCSNAKFQAPYTGVQQPTCTYVAVLGDGSPLTAAATGLEEQQKVKCVVYDGQKSNTVSTTYTVLPEEYDTGAFTAKAKLFDSDGKVNSVYTNVDGRVVIDASYTNDREKSMSVKVGCKFTRISKEGFDSYNNILEAWSYVANVAPGEKTSFSIEKTLSIAGVWNSISCTPYSVENGVSTPLATSERLDSIDVRFSALQYSTDLPIGGGIFNPAQRLINFPYKLLKLPNQCKPGDENCVFQLAGTPSDFIGTGDYTIGLALSGVSMSNEPKTVNIPLGLPLPGNVLMEMTGQYSNSPFKLVRRAFTVVAGTKSLSISFTDTKTVITGLDADGATTFTKSFNDNKKEIKSIHLYKERT
ncbi:MAG: hypothetical protein ABIG30_03655 [Candidatus Aenigmatarchaeota archaeon]